MIFHYIFMSSSYTEGTRIAFDYIPKGETENNKSKELMKTIKQIAGEDAPISVHLIPTDSESWESVEKADPYFKGVKIINKIEEFSKLIARDRVLNGLDVAKYILTKVKCTHLKLEKMVYLCYADYLNNTHKKLFEDKIMAYRYGPVVKSVYNIFKQQYGYLPVSKEKDNIDSSTLQELPAKSRILFAKDGIEKCKSIEQTIAKYGDKSARALVDITHRKGSPWDEVHSDIIIKEIVDEVILKKHWIENINN